MIVGIAGEQEYRSNAMANFQKIMSDINSIALYDDYVEQLMKQVADIEEKVEDESDEDAAEFGEEQYYI